LLQLATPAPKQAVQLPGPTFPSPFHYPVAPPGTIATAMGWGTNSPVVADYPNLLYEVDLPMIPANEGELNQIWTNLIDNAIDAMDEGGNLTLRARRNAMWVEVEIVDDGSGIPDEIRSRIFEPFFTTKAVGDGTGLGLGIAQRIARTHQGYIEAMSEPGRTVMCVRLSLAASRRSGRPLPCTG